MTIANSSIDRFKAFLSEHGCSRSLKLLDRYQQELLKAEDLEDLINHFIDNPEEALIKSKNISQIKSTFEL